MNPATLALLIPILAIVGGFIISIMKLRDSQGKAQAEYDKHTQVLQKELDGLRQRVETLERLVTDDAYDIKRNIENA
ncbi:hypothetical protein [Shewanella gaetbuli]|uniref:Phage shock protein B n=1 Tax=Shewanella gaetbuli TaxID=220752 RepID=A0A9X1ZIV6_9GAMM|nr:hypothetical protein [Shewanella gaetbuli]MCL1142523.1 hypothetical protein [Shewanella gaetbuli]